MASKHLCQPCETVDTFVPAVKWCTECEEKLCKECFQFHKKGKATKNHHVLDISEADIFPTLKNQHCSKHTGMLLDLFCVDHDSLSCRQCMTEEHRACNKLLPLDVAAKDVGSSALVIDLLKDFELSVTALCSIETAIEKELKVEEDQRIAKHKDITSLKARVCKQIEESASVLGEKIETVSKEHRLHLQKQEHSITESKVLNIKHKEELEKVIKYGSNSQIFILAHELKLLQTKEEALSIDICQKLDKIEIHLPKKHELPSSSFFGDISIEKTPLNLHAKFSKAQVAESILHNDSVKTLYCKSTKNFKSKIRGIAITKNNDVLICSEFDSTVLRFFSNGEFDNSCNVSDKAFNICVIDETDEAVITLPHIRKIQFIKYIPMKAGKTVNTFPHPWGITLCKDKLIVGTFKKMQFFTTDGSPLHIVDVPCVDKTAICYMHIGDKNQIFVSCHSFYGITEDGKLVLEHSRPPNRRTYGICVDRDGSVYVASQNSVVRLSKEGKVLDQDILDKVKQYGDIWGIAFNRTYTQMYAATNDGLQLTVFDFK
ncbi:uncharacterized protein LOC127706415 [Mytilus californianus]|uniref:uncharacterized protein LOC127706415 n=1 Tax=Mytilus californianus TaxID=6549 RepID=UPI00224793FF|nr:uncharacterized protein LOC127706415 [Mytilus californianus]